jgi:octaprenyl-diphosphate synthase
MAAPFLKAHQIQRPILKELAMLEGRLEALLRSDVALVYGIGEHLLAIKGKRIRPTLVLLCSHLGRPDAERAVMAGVAIELIHTATLLHDDSIDKSDLRRGLPTVNKLWDEQVSVIMGDHLFCKAFKLLHESGMETVARAMVDGSDRMTFGEMYQMDKRGDCDMTEETYIDVIRNKTASLFSTACETGAMIGGLSEGECRVLYEYGEDIGIAFQIIDDVLDFVGDVEHMGKPVGNDVRDGRVTLPLIVAMRNAPSGHTSDMRAALCGADFSQGRWQEIVEFLTAHGGISYSRDLSARLVKSAKARLSGLKDCPARTSLLLLADYVVSRQK